jgi:hypothetical protein
VVGVAGPQQSQLMSGLVVLVAGLAGAVTFLTAQWALGSPEMAALTSLARRRGTAVQPGVPPAE